MSSATVTTITTSYTGTAGGSVPWKYQLEISPDNAGTPVGYYDDPKGPKKAQTEPVAFVAGLDGFTALTADDILAGMLAADTFYWVRVRVTDTAGNTAYSNALKIKTLKFVPGNVTVTLQNTGLLHLSYTGTTGLIAPTTYRYQQCGDSGGAPDGSWVDLGFDDHGPEPITHDPSGLTLDTPYWFRMRIVDLTGIIQYSDPKMGKPRELITTSNGNTDVKFVTIVFKDGATHAVLGSYLLTWSEFGQSWDHGAPAGDSPPRTSVYGGGGGALAIYIDNWIGFGARFSGSGGGGNNLLDGILTVVWTHIFGESWTFGTNEVVTLE